MERLASERLHANGVIARAWRSPDGSFSALCQRTTLASDMTTSAPYCCGLPSLKAARDRADAMAHPGCDGSCSGWTRKRARYVARS
jgi:hypothetical protein